MIVFVCICVVYFCFFKQKTAYEMRISDWSSDVCSSDLPLAGSFDIKEGFVEIAAPIARNAPLVELLEFNAAARVADYSTSGTVVTWKFGANYMPISGLRFRATRSRDIRGPNVAELFTGGSQGRSEEHTSELQSLMRNSYAVFCL